MVQTGVRSIDTGSIHFLAPSEKYVEDGVKMVTLVGSRNFLHLKLFHPRNWNGKAACSEHWSD